MAEAAFQAAPQATSAYNAACAFVRAGDVNSAMRMLALASQNGFDDVALASNDPALASLRGVTAFESWLAHLSKN